MLQAEGTGRVARFGAFELDRHTGELRKHGIRVRLQGKPFQILIALLERPGETVSRDELRQRLWPGDTFVDFESGLNTAANRLRIALGDSADNPRYIETLARFGYRFIAPVEEVLPPGPPVEHLRPANSAENNEAPEPSSPRHSPPSRKWLIAAALIATAGAGMLLGRIWSSVRTGDVSLHQITYQRGVVPNGRFAPDGTVVYSARWMRSPLEVYLANSLSPESRPLGFKGSTVAGVSKSGELALIEWNHSNPSAPAMLSRVPINGGAPLQLTKMVGWADWSTDGNQLAIVRHTATEDVIEYPIGKPLYHSWGYLSDLRMSPSGDALAFWEHPYRYDDGGKLNLIDLKGKVRTLTAGWASAGGLAWTPSGTEIYFTATRQGSARKLNAVTRDGKAREVAKVPGSMLIHDIAPDGRILISRENRNLVMEAWTEDQPKARDLSWFDWSNVVACSDDGDLVLFDESGEGGGPQYSTYLRRMSSGETTRLGPGRAMALAPDGKSAITMAHDNYTMLQIVPVGPGQTKTVEGHGIQYQSVYYMPDGQSIVIVGQEQDKPLRLYTQDLNGGPPKPINVQVQPFWIALSPDGKSIAGRTQDGKLVVVPAAGGTAHVVPISAPAVPIRWTEDGKALYAFCVDSETSNEISIVDLHTGRCTPFHQIEPSEPDGDLKVNRVVMSADGKSIVYSYHRTLSELYIASGW